MKKYRAWLSFLVLWAVVCCPCRGEESLSLSLREAIELALRGNARLRAAAELSAKHLPAYLDEMAFRYNNRENPYLFRDTLLRLIRAENLPYEKLTSQ